MLELEVVIRGRVQLVMFRDFARRSALSLGLSGYVENRSDGTVYVCAQGEELVLNEFLSQLKQGPVFARVDGVQHSFRTPIGAHEGFHIRY